MNTFAITVETGGQIIKAVSNGTEEGTVITGSDDHVRRVHKALRLGTLVDIVNTRLSPAIRSSCNDPIALTAALYSVNPYYTTLIDAPPMVFEFFRWCIERDMCGSVVQIVED